MQTKGKIFLQVLLNRFHKGPIEEIYQLLPEEEAEQLRTLAASSTETAPAVAQAEELLQKLHYSWLVTYLRKLPEEQQKLIVKALPAHPGDKVAEVMQLERAKSPLNSHIRTFFLDKFYKEIPHEELLPSEYLPESPLSPLLTFDKKGLIHAIDLLGVYDLAESIRKVVDKRQLKSLMACLSPSQQRFLRLCLNKKDKISMAKTVLDKDPKTLRKTLHIRGLTRLGIAVSNESQDFLWHLTHTLDTGRSAIIEKCFQKEHPKKVVQTLNHQILNLLNFLEKGAL